MSIRRCKSINEAMDKINKIMISSVESAAQMSVGQAFLKFIDKMLWIIEKSVQWSVPTQDLTLEENGKSFGKVELVRPLPWILFLPTLIVLRMARFSINVTATIFGYPRVEPSDMIRVIQRGRRRIRAVKSSGLKNMRLKKVHVTKDRPMTIKEASKSLARTLRLTLSTLSCLDSGSKMPPSPPPTKIRVSNFFDSTPQLTEEKCESGVVSPGQLESKRKFSEIRSDDSSEDESDDEPLVSKIDRLANDYESDKDKDYVPNGSSSSDLSTTDLEELEANLSISLSEVKDLEEDQGQLERGFTMDVEEGNVNCYSEHNFKNSITQIDNTPL